MGQYENLKVDALEPLYFTLGKISRSLDQDLDDIAAVVKAEKIAGRDLAKLWAEALKNSELSSELLNIKRQMIYFLKVKGSDLWPSEKNLVDLFENTLKT